MQEMDQTGYEPQVLANHAHDFSKAENQQMDDGVKGGCVPDKSLELNDLMQSLSLAEARYQQYLQPPTSESQPHSTKMSVGTMSPSPQISTSAQRGPSDSPLTKPTPEQLKASHVLVQRLREDAAVRLNDEFLCKNVPEQERDAYNSVFEQVSKLVTDCDRTATSNHALFRDENKAKALVNAISLFQRQRALLSNSPPEF